MWPRAAATGIGSLPGTDIDEAVRLVLDELPDLPYLPELPARGPGADMIGRSTGLLVDLPVDLYAGRWRVAGRPGRDLRRTRDLWERDLDAVTELAAGYDGMFKVQVAGPWTLAAQIELAIGGRLLRDAGAVRDLTASLAEGVAGHVRDMARRLPQARLVVQVDEPALPAVLAGHIATESGFSVLPGVETATARTVLAEVIDAAGVPVVVHCCASDVPVRLIREAGASGVSFDAALIGDLDPLGEAVEAGVHLVIGALPTTPPGRGDAEVAEVIRGMWQRLGFPAGLLAEKVTVSPACGLAGASMDFARTAMIRCRDAGRRLAEA